MFRGTQEPIVSHTPYRVLQDYLLGRRSSQDVASFLASWYAHEPSCGFSLLSESISDAECDQLLAQLAGKDMPEAVYAKGDGHYQLSNDELSLAKGRLWLLGLMWVTLPARFVSNGSRACAKGSEDVAVSDMLRNLDALYRELPLLDVSDIEFLIMDSPDVLAYMRTTRAGSEAYAVLINRSLEHHADVCLPLLTEAVTELIDGVPLHVHENSIQLTLRPLGSALIHYHPQKRLAKELERGSGVLCHITSLPHDSGLGVIGQAAYDFIDTLAAAGQRYWQVLPVNPCDSYGSPYAGPSAFAGNLDLLEGGSAGLRACYDAERAHSDSDFAEFCRTNDDWLKPYATFMAVCDICGSAEWQRWPEAFRSYSEAIAQRSDCAEAYGFYRWAQWQFEKSWCELKNYAHSQGLLIIGDMPIYVSHTSVDVWSHPELFSLDEAGYPHELAGAPPDQFTPDGQLWGNPTYMWATMEAQGYVWWERRLRRMTSLYDFVRLDHFVGYDQYYSIPKGSGAQEGRWLLGPTFKLFSHLYESMGELAVIAEDLGIVTSAVRALLSAVGCAGMDVIQFADGDVRECYQVHPERVAYSSTHDTPTLRGWCRERYADTDDAALAEHLLETLMASPARVVMLSLQDVLGLGAEARMNTPGTAEGNWRWQLTNKEIEPAAFTRLRELSERYGRASADSL